MKDSFSVVKRTTLLVSNLSRSIEFYKAIGFSEWHAGGGDRDADMEAGLPLSGKPTRYDYAIMAGKHPAWGMIGLLEFSGPPLPWSREADDTDLGITDAVLVVGTDDIRATYDNLMAIGATILKAPNDWTGFHDGQGAIMMLLDPDGQVVEMMETDGEIPDA